MNNRIALSVRFWRRCCAWALLVLAGGMVMAEDESADADARADATAVVLTLDGAIGPAGSDYVRRGLEYAREQGARVVVLAMDTPGGLDTSMRDIIRRILSSPVPVLTYVTPGGARAASAGTYILYASHIASMAPGTNLGAATPVQLIGGSSPAGESDDSGTQDKQGEQQTGREEATGKEAGREESGKKGKDGDGSSSEKSTPKSGDAMSKKMINDASAYIRSLAELRDRNAEWAEQAVRSAASLSASEALERNVIDLVADNISDLLEQADGRSVSVDGEPVTLQTKGLEIDRFDPDWRNRLLSVITNPNVAYVLMLIGVYGLFFEFSNPGFVLPGVAGAISLILALYAFHVLPVNYAALALVLLGVAFMVAEVFMPSFGALGIGGLIAFVVGSMVLMDTDSELYQLSLPLVLAVAAASAIFVFAVVGALMRARQRPVVSGRESLLGAEAEAVEDFSGAGRVRAQGEIWQATSAVPVRTGQRLRIVGRDGLVVAVQPVQEA